MPIIRIGIWIICFIWIPVAITLNTSTISKDLKKRLIDENETETPSQENNINQTLQLTDQPVKDNFTSIQKQAIPLAVVQSGTLGDMHVSKEHKKQDNSTENGSTLCNENYQNCPAHLIEQAKIDKKLRMNSSYFNVTESAYNASIAAALDNNKTTVIFNKTIHLLQNFTETKYQPDYQPIDQSLNKTSKLIYVPPYKNNTGTKEGASSNNDSNSEIDKLNDIISSLSNQTNSSNIITIKSKSLTDRKLSVNHEPIITYINDTIFNKFTNATNQDLTNDYLEDNLNKRVILMLPHSHYILSSEFDKGLKNKFQKSSDENQGILLGPLDDLPDNPNGNGPHEKKRKNLEGSNILEANIGEKQKKKGRPRQKRQSFRFDLTDHKEHPFEYTMDSKGLENNYDYRDLKRKSTPPAYQPGFAIPANLFKKDSLSSDNENGSPRDEIEETDLNNNFENDNPEDPANLPDVPEQRFNFRQQLYNGLPEPNYDQFVEGEAGNIDRSASPKIGTGMDVNGIVNSRNEQIGPPILEEPAYKPENILEKSMQNIISDNNDDMKSFADKLITPDVLASYRTKTLTLDEFGANRRNQMAPFYDQSNNPLAAREAIPEAPLEMTIKKKLVRNNELQALLRKYNEQTRRIESLRSRLEPLAKNQQPITEDDIERLHEEEGSSLHNPNFHDTNQRNLIQNEIISNAMNQYGRDAQTQPISTNQNTLYSLRQSTIQSRSIPSEHHELLSDPSSVNPNLNNEVRGTLIGEEHRSFENQFSPSEEENNQPQKIWNDVQAQRKNILGRNDIYQPPQTSEAENPDNFLRQNIITEFMRYMALRNKILQRNEEYYPPSFTNTESAPVVNEHEDYTNIQPQINNARNMLPSSSNYHTFIPQLNQGGLLPTFPSDLLPNFMDDGNQLKNSIANQQGIVMLMVTTPPDDKESDNDHDAKKETVKHKELTKDGITRTNVKVNNTDDDRDFSVNLKKAADFVLNKAVEDGNITNFQRDQIQVKLRKMLDREYKNKTKSEIRTREDIPKADSNYCEDTMKDCLQFKLGGVCPFMRTFVRGACRNSCDECTTTSFNTMPILPANFTLMKGENIAKIPNEKRSGSSVIPNVNPNHRPVIKRLKIPSDPVMYLTFEKSSRDGVVDDNTVNKNNAILENGAEVSPRLLGTCGKAAELNDGSVSWSGDNFKRKPDSAISIGMWVKVRKGGVINWFANGKKGNKMFYTKTKGTVVPPKVWTHVAGTFDSNSGLARIYINGNLEQEQQQNRGEKLAKNWLVNGIGGNFGDDSLHYVDEVIIYDRALTNAEVRMLVNHCTFNRMVLHYGFQKGNKTNIADQSGLDNNAILIGGAAQKENCDRCGSCLDLSKGPDPTMKIQQISEKYLPKYKVSIAAWVSLNTTKGVHNIFATESSDGNIGYRLQVIRGRIRWAIGTDTIPVIFDNMTKNEVVPEALWTHIIATYNNENGVTKIYANSMLKFNDIVPEEKRAMLPTNWDNDASIGDHTFRGFMDEFILYNWELDDSEALYVRNYCADHPKLVRFTVRVPLTKKTFVPKSPLNKKDAISKDLKKRKQRVSKKRSSIPLSPLQKKKSDMNWYIYLKLLNEKLARHRISHLNSNSNQYINSDSNLRRDSQMKVYDPNENQRDTYIENRNHPNNIQKYWTSHNNIEIRRSPLDNHEKLYAIEYKRNNGNINRRPEQKRISEQDLIKKREKIVKAMQKLAEDPNEAFIILKK